VITTPRLSRLNRSDASIFDQITDTGADPDSSGTRPRNPVTRLVRWVLLSGDRRVLALVTEIVILVALLTVGTVWEFEMERLVTETRAVQTLFNTLLGGIILFVSVVLSINTAALAQEFAPLQVKLASIEDSIDFQIELEELVEDGISPAGLQPFLQYVIEAIHSETESLRTTDGSTTDERARANLLTFADDIDTRLSQIERRIRQSDPRVSILLLSTLDYPYARHINVTRRLKATHGDVLTESDHESLATLLRILTILASGREYFTTLYFKREPEPIERPPPSLAPGHRLHVVRSARDGHRTLPANDAPGSRIETPLCQPRVRYRAFPVRASQFVHASHAYRLETLPRIDGVHPQGRCRTGVRSVVHPADSQLNNLDGYRPQWPI